METHELKNYKMGVSVIIPAYNRISMLEDALHSALAQDYTGEVEIIVVDDNSQDGTSEIVREKYPTVELVSLKQNVGAYAARNIALRQAQGQYIAFLDSDDLWEKEYLSTQLLALESQVKQFCVSALVSWYVSTGQRVVKSQKPKLKKYTSALHHLLSGGSFIFTPTSVVFPRGLFDDVGLFDETLRMAGDTDFYIRCLLAGYEPIFTEEPMAIRRMHGKGQLTGVSNIETRKAGRIERATKYYPLIPEVNRVVPIKRIYAEIHSYFSSRYFQEKYLYQWIATSMNAAAYDPIFAMSSLVGDIKNFLRYRLQI
ncbi:glycosyltransferase family 2 protein [Acaryochloris sp. IP29b_bin.148]|uniref:glycosyltransferase family 2 protein n=1 Tax=Acaryochloris sp. IP29b_bin.148 TaxID=2969218 RepID=UPI00262B9E36|nr:glycosyltransferase family 2 protein [Acaryochloris sp. IP29b_bin.148]